MSKEALLLGTAGKGHVTQSARMFKRETSFGCTCPARGGETRALEAKPRLSFAFGSQETKAGRRGGAGRGRRRGQRCWHRGARRLGTEARGPRWGQSRRDRVAGTDAGAEVGTEARRQTRGPRWGQRRGGRRGGRGGDRGAEADAGTDGAPLTPPAAPATPLPGGPDAVAEFLPHPI